ncbi:hypothetical protein N7470_007076 [Penicillium chermesinum]|nr:hypothetical protein N7470_007076 [Penicillium chermesinum]
MPSLAAFAPAFSSSLSRIHGRPGTLFEPYASSSLPPSSSHSPPSAYTLARKLRSLQPPRYFQVVAWTAVTSPLALWKNAVALQVGGYQSSHILGRGKSLIVGSYESTGDHPFTWTRRDGPGS